MALGHAAQDPDTAVGGRNSHKSGNPAHDKKCEIARLCLKLDKIGSEEWVSG